MVDVEPAFFVVRDARGVFGGLARGVHGIVWGNPYAHRTLSTVFRRARFAYGRHRRRAAAVHRVAQLWRRGTFVAVLRVDLRDALKSDGWDVTDVRPLVTSNPGRVFENLIIVSLPAQGAGYSPWGTNIELTEGLAQLK